MTAQLRQKRWLVYAKPPFGGPDKILDYLGRYTHRVAISNNRILNVGNGGVTFAFRDRTDDNKRKAMSLPAEEFIRRFLLHSLPAAFVRMRHFGFPANRAKKHDLPLCRQLLGVSPQPPAPERKSDEELLQELTGEDFFRCPYCKQGSMHIVAELPKPSFPPSVPHDDSSPGQGLFQKALPKESGWNFVFRITLQANLSHTPVFPGRTWGPRRLNGSRTLLQAQITQRNHDSLAGLQPLIILQST